MMFLVVVTIKQNLTVIRVSFQIANRVPSTARTKKTFPIFVFALFDEGLAAMTYLVTRLPISKKRAGSTFYVPNGTARPTSSVPFGTDWAIAHKKSAGGALLRQRHTNCLNHLQ